jgi:4-hydroxy-2-oxoheptanedioate aldolase
MARVHENNFYAIGRLLDRGAMGVIVPMVNNRGDAEAAAFAMRYPPRGGRSVGAFAVEHYGSEYGQAINEQLFLAVQIETAEAVENAEIILSVPGVDGCWIGPGDLSGSLGTDLSTGPGRQRHEDTIMRVLDVCHKTGKVPGIAAGYDVERWLGKGFLFLTGLSDMGFVRDGARDLLMRYRSLLAGGR